MPLGSRPACRSRTRVKPSSARTLLSVALPLESVPNFSVGADQSAIGAITAALASRTAVLDVHTDLDHNRSVFTVAAAADALVEGLFAATEAAVNTTDIREHAGVHPRIGVADVIPIIPLSEGARDSALDAALELGERLGGELDLPVFLYGQSCPPGRGAEGKRPAFYRRGGLSALAARVMSGELQPDFGPSRPHASAGATLVGVRRPLIAFNVDLATDDLDVARAIAARIREADGGFTGVRALGVALETKGIVQVSTNIEDWQSAAPHRIVAAIEAEATARGVEVVSSELVGLLPVGAALAAASETLRLPELAAGNVLELRLLEETMARQKQES